MSEPIGYLSIAHYTTPIASIVVTDTGFVMEGVPFETDGAPFSGPVLVRSTSGNVVIEGSEILEFPAISSIDRACLTFRLNINELTKMDGYIPAVRS